MRRFFLGLFLCGSAFASSLPSGLSQSDINRLTLLVGMSGSTRLLRSAEAYPPWPGIKFGIEVTLIQGPFVSELGNQDGSVSWLLPSPRIYLAKGLFPGAELVFSFFPTVLNTVAGAGGILKWTFLEEKQNWLSLAGLLGITGVTAFRNEFEAADVEFGVVISKDYVRLKPYLGGGLMFARGTVLPGLATGVTQSAAMMGTHLFLGVEWNKPLDFAVQIDFFNFVPTMTFFFGKGF